jgi:hypothetical protein
VQPPNIVVPVPMPDDEEEDVDLVKLEQVEAGEDD